MTFVLGSALIATSLVHLLKNMIGFKEGFIEETTEEEFKEGIDEDQDNSPKKKGIKKPTANTNLKHSLKNPETNDAEKKIIDIKTEKVENNDSDNTKANKKTGFTNKKLSPAIINNIPNKDKLTQNMSKADNIEAAYDNLEKTIGDNNIKSMSNATKDLIAQQNQLVKGLKDVTPVLNEAMGALSKIDLSSLSGMFNKFG